MDMNNTLENLMKIDSEVENAKNQRANLEGQVEQIMNGLEEKGFESMEEGEERIEELTRLLQVDKKKLAKGWEGMVEKHGDLFKSIGITSTTL